MFSRGAPAQRHLIYNDHMHNTHIIWKTIHGLPNRAPPPTINTSITFRNKFRNKKGIELIISAIISLQSLIFKWTTFEISLSLTRFNVLLLCVDYSNSTCIDNSLYKHTHNFLSMVNTGYISDVIQVQSHTVWKGILMGGGGGGET